MNLRIRSYHSSNRNDTIVSFGFDESESQPPQISLAAGEGGGEGSYPKTTMRLPPSNAEAEWWKRGEGGVPLTWMRVQHTARRWACTVSMYVSAAGNTLP